MSNIEELREENAKLRKALEPFAKYAGDPSHIKQRAFLQLLICPFGDEHPDNHVPYFQATRSALAQQPLSVQEGWRPIAEADNGIAHIIDAAGLHIGNSLPIWARDIDGCVFECLWADDGKRAYWWDIEGESPVDPVEFMPHPLAALKATGGAPE